MNGGCMQSWLQSALTLPAEEVEHDANADEHDN